MRIPVFLKKIVRVRYLLIRIWWKLKAHLRSPAATLWRFALFRTTIIAISGSTGKTTTKELLAKILSSKYQTAKTSGTWGGYKLGGVAGTLLSIRPWHRFAVIETAIETPGQMECMAKMLRPHMVVMLGVKPLHINTFKTIENIAIEKAKLVQALGPGHIAVLNQDDPHVRSMAGLGKFTTYTFGMSPHADLWASNSSSLWPGRLGFQVHKQDTTLSVQTSLLGTHWVSSILAALLVGECCGVPLEQGIKVVESIQPFWARMQPITLSNGATIIRDEWNGSHTTFEMAFSVMEQATAERKIVVVSDYSDTNTKDRYRGRWLGREAARVADTAVFVGERRLQAQRAAIESGMNPEQVHVFATVADAATFLKHELQQGDIVLLKGRTSHHLSRIYLAQLGEVSCTLDTCPRQILCDRCGQLGFRWRPEFDGRMVPPDIYA